MSEVEPVKTDWKTEAAKAGKIAVPSAAGIGVGYLIIQDVIDLLRNSDAEKLAEISKLMSQFGTIPFVAALAIVAVVYLAVLNISAKNAHIADLKKR